jgi:CSLREA domain-containing protein
MIDMKRGKRALATATLAGLRRPRPTSSHRLWIRGRLRAALALGVLALSLAVGVPAAYAAIITVNTTADELNSDGDCSLREAIQAANTNLPVDACPAGTPGLDVVMFSVTGTITLTSGQLTITDHLTIDGPGPGAANMTISGNNASRVLQVAGGTTLDLKDVTVADGAGVGTGAGIFNAGGTLTVTDTTFSGNAAGAVGSGGGAIFSFDGTLTVTNSTFSGNSASAGGAIFTDGTGSLTVTNSTFSGNSADIGGGIFNGGFGTTLRNTIVANSPSGGNCSGVIIDGLGNLQHPGMDCGATIPSADPLLGSLQDNGGPTETMALPPESPAIDAAVACPPPLTDQRGVVRPQGNGCDIGAFELEVAVCPPGDDDLDDDGLDDESEDLFGNLLNDDDSDDDGIRDGDDDGDDDGEDDEDEDDGTDPCPEDGDGDGEDDEDEDDEEDDDD